MRPLLLFCLMTLVLSSTAVADDHDHLGDVRCLDCHGYLPLRNVPTPPFEEGIAAVCQQCHQEKGCWSNNSKTTFVHPMEIVPTKKIPADMPLDRNGKLTCITCHYFHPKKRMARQTGFMLRRQPGKTFCYYCHQNL